MRNIIYLLIISFVAIQASVFGETLTTEYLVLSSDTAGVEAIKEKNTDITIFVNKSFKKSDTVAINIQDIIEDDWVFVSPNSGDISLSVGGSITYEMRCKTGSEDNKVGVITIKEFEVVFCVYVDQPVNGTSIAFDYKWVNGIQTYDYGHVFGELQIRPKDLVEELIPLEKRKYINISAGFYPTLNLSYPRFECPGKIEMPDMQHPKEITYEQGITLNDCINGLEKLRLTESNPGIYNAKTHNCVHFIRALGEAVGVELPDGESMVVNDTYISNAGEFGMQILEMKGNGR